ncbi:MAG: hypothetical protein QGF25_07120, partial [Candidatus Woesearchaeota archaeon]|nr:hypothetical protein [Candidatus Woesearchaeota archaeon]
MDLEEALKYTFPNKVNALSHTKWVLNYLIHTEQRRLQAAKDQESEHTFGADLAHSLLNKVPEANVAPEHAPLQSPDISSPEACAASTLARHVRTFVETHPDEL